MASSAYTISEAGRCIGTSTSYNIAAPTVGTTAQSGVTVAVMNPDGTAVSGAVVSYSQGSWTAMGTTATTGQVNAPLADGTYDFRVVLGGTTNTLSGVNVKQGTLVTFPTVRLTATLANASGPLSGGSVSVRSSGGSSSAIGATSASGSVSAQVLPAIYDVTMTYAARSMTQTSISVNSPTTVAFSTHTLTVKLLNAGGSPQSGGSVSVTPSGGSAFGLGTTNASGIVTATVLDGAYTVSMTSGGMTSTQNVTLSGDTTVTFQPSTSTLSMRSSTGGALSGQDSAIWWRPSGSSSWSFAGYPDASGNVSISLLAGTYDFEARWFGVYEVKSAVAISGATTLTWQTFAATEFMRSSTGSGLSGQDSAIWVRPAGSGGWYFSGYPNGSGQVVQELLASSYDFEARWFGVYEVKSAVSIAADSTVTWQALAATEFMESSTGSGLSGQDSAIWVRPAGSGGWYFSGYPNGSGQVVQQLLASSYDFQARWFGVYEVKSAVSIAADSTVTWQTLAATEFMRSSTGSGLSGQDSAIWVRPAGSGGWYFSGYPNGSGQVVQELLASSYDFQARWFGVYEVKSAVAVSAATTVTWQTLAATEFMESSTGSGLSGQDSAIWVRPAGSGGWYFSGYPNGSGQVVQELLASSYDFQARWFGVYEVKSAVSIAANSTVTWQTLAATEFMRSSTGSGLSGQDSAIWVRPAGSGGWYFSGYPNGSGQVVQELLASSYDFQARWFGQYQVQSAVPISASATVTFQGEAATLSLLSSTGSGLSGQDSAIWVRPAGTSSWYFSGYPNGSGQVVQQLLDGSYDVQFRWLGTYQVSSANAVAGATAITANAAAVNITARKTSDNSPVSGAATYVITGGGSNFVGYTDNNGQLTAQVLVGTVNVQCTKSPLTGTNSNLVVGSGGVTTTVMVA